MISYRMCLKLIATSTAKITTKQQRPDCRMARQVQACERKCRCPQRADWSIDVAEAREPPPNIKDGAAPSWPRRLAGLHRWPAASVHG